MSRLSGEQMKIGYGDSTIINNLDVAIPDGKVTSIIGPNGCGKSTLLKALSRLLSIKEGRINLDGKSIHATSTKEIAKKIAILPQSPEVPDGLTVGELVSYGRFPHQKGFGRLTAEDKNVVILYGLIDLNKSKFEPFFKNLGPIFANGPNNNVLSPSI